MTNLVRINFIVEGQTEETLVRDQLVPWLAGHHIMAAVRCVEAGRRAHRIYRGGLLNYGKARHDIQRWLSEDRTAFLTTMFDLYRLPNDFPGWVASRRVRDPHRRVALLENAMTTDIDNRRFLPYLQLHEFEGLLFSDSESIDNVLHIQQGTSRLMELREIRDQFPTPEHIDDGAHTAPSKRLLELYPGYDKVAFGSLICKSIGLDRICQECPHFSEWLQCLASLTPIS